MSPKTMEGGEITAMTFNDAQGVSKDFTRDLPRLYTNISRSVGQRGRSPSMMLRWRLANRDAVPGNTLLISAPAGDQKCNS